MRYNWNFLEYMYLLIYKGFFKAIHERIFYICINLFMISSANLVKKLAEIITAPKNIYVYHIGKCIHSSWYPFVLSLSYYLASCLLKCCTNISISQLQATMERAWCFVRRLVGQLKRRRQRSTMEEMIITNMLSDPIIYRCRSCVGNCECAAMRSDLIWMGRAY